MKMHFYIAAICFVLVSLSAIQSKYPVRYDRVQEKIESNGSLELNKDSTFLAKEFGGCDGVIESKGKWKFRVDTLILSNIKWHMNDDSLKEVKGDQRFLVKKDSLIGFSIVNNETRLNRNDVYKRSRK